MTETKKTVRKSSGTKSSAARRDAYDDFLDMTVEKKSSSGTRKKSDSSKKTGATASKTRTGNDGTKKSPASDGKKKSAGTGSRRTSAEKTSAARKVPTKKDSAKKPADLLETWEELVDGAEEERRTAQRRRKTSQSRSRDASGRPGKTTGGKRRRAASGAVLLVDNERDAFDDFLEQTAPKKPPRKRRKKKKKKGSPGVTLALLLGIACIVALGAWQNAEYRTFQTMKEAVSHQGFYEGTTVEGVNVAGMTLEQAIDYWEQNIEPQYSRKTITLSNGASLTSAELGYSSDYLSVLSTAWGAGRSGSLEERYEMITARRDRPVSYNVTRTPYSQQAVIACVQAIAAQIDRPAEDAHIQSFDVDSLEFAFKDEVVGSQLDQVQLAQNMVQALENGGGTVEIPVNAIQPKVKKADVAADYGMITYAVTNASSSSKNRLTNIRLALESINGYCLEPGETFSFNETVGKRTSERGYKVATAYSGGEVTEEVGGGICQVSTTLFNAAVKADLEIVERHNHSLTVSYVDKGKDASVNWNSQDLRFTNTGDDNVYITCFLSEDKRVYVGVFGKLLPNGETITVKGKTTGTIEYETVFQPSLSLAPGTSQVTQEGKNGYTAVAYKIRWDANGNEISSELLCKSTYKATKEIVEYGP